MPDLEGARRLLAMAVKDLNALGGMVDQERFADEIFGFHAQQAIEKALKGWLALLDVEFPKTHDLRVLLVLLNDQAIDVEGLWDVVEYNLFAVQFRYDAFDSFEDTLDRPAVTARVAEIVELVQQHIKKSSASGSVE